jgi:hypothetical protein
MDINDAAVEKRVVEEGNLRLPAWVQASKLKRATGTFHIRFLSGKATEIVETAHGTEGAGPGFIKDPDTTPLMTAAFQGHVDRLQQLIGEGQKVNAQDQLGNTALFGAVASGNIEALRFLIARGADVNARNVDGETALTAAAVSGHTDMVTELAERGATFDCTDPVDRETLFTEERKSNLSLVSMLKKIGIHCLPSASHR